MADDFDRYIAHAIQWAAARIGAKDYATRCLAFVEDAYEQGNHIELFGGSTAKESADAYAAYRYIEQLPPPGAFVFYDCFGTLFNERKNWGHVGLCLGSEQVIHAWDTVRQDHYLDVQHLTPAPGWQSPHYIGWAPVERLLAGYRKKG